MQDVVRMYFQVALDNNNNNNNKQQICDKYTNKQTNITRTNSRDVYGIR